MLPCAALAEKHEVVFSLAGFGETTFLRDACNINCGYTQVVWVCALPSFD